MQENLPNNLLRSGKDCATIYMENGRLCVHIGCVLPRMPDGIPAGDRGTMQGGRIMKKRLLALLLCLVMVIGLVPTVLADEPAADTYEIWLDLHDGTTNYPHFTVEKGANKDSTAVAQYASRAGYTLKRWYAGESTYTFDNGVYDDTPDAYGCFWVHAEWKENTYKVVFDANGGTGTMADQTFTGSVGYTVLAKNAFTKTGYTFAGWGLSATSNAVTYSDNNCAVTTTVQNFFTKQADGTYLLTLYAIWKPIEPPAVLRKITYKDADHLNNFDGIMYDYVNNGDYIYIDPKGGTAKLGGTEITTAGRYKIESDVTLTEPTGALGWTYNGTIEPHTFVAVWPSTKTVTISYLDYYYGADTETIKYDGSIIVDPNGGSVVWGRTTISSKQTIENIRTDAALEKATRSGYTFYGWVVTYTADRTPVFTAAWSRDYYYNTYSIYYYDYDDCKSEYANFPYGTSVVIDPNGGTAKLSGTSFSTKQSFNIYRDYTLTDASRSGYTFYGWDLTKSGSTYYFTAMWSRYKSDVPYMLNGTDHYAYIKGYPNGSFKPTDTITRAEAATIFYRLLTDSTRKAYATTYNSFKDVPATAWYNTAVSTMAKLGIVNGGADGYFRPNDPITRAEIAAMIARCDGAYYTGTSTVFSDTYGHWAAGYIDRAYELGWINGYGTTYAPDRYISRAETVAVLNRVLNRAPQYTSDLTRNYTTFSDVATSAWYYLDVEEAANSHTYTRKSNADYETWTKLIADPSWF